MELSARPRGKGAKGSLLGISGLACNASLPLRAGSRGKAFINTKGSNSLVSKDEKIVFR